MGYRAQGGLGVDRNQSLSNPINHAQPFVPLFVVDDPIPVERPGEHLAVVWKDEGVIVSVRFWMNHSKAMNTELKQYLETAQGFHRRIEAHFTQKGVLSLEMADNVYNLRRIKIAVAYRSNVHGIPIEDKKAIEEICQLYADAEAMLRKVHSKKGAPEKVR